MINKQWMIYGANGYTGKLIAEAAVARGLQPILAGRREEQIKPIAQSLELEWLCFDLQDSAVIEKALKNCALLLHCAGPFSATSAPMVAACLKTKTHYLDITGEIPIFEAIQRLDNEAKQAGVVLMPGVGFDVVPTDCLAAMLAKRIPNATHLEMAFCGDGGISPGTTKTMIEMMSDRCQVRRDHKIITVANGYKRKMIAFPHQSLYCMTIPWGDISTAYYSTGIANIEVYTAVPKALGIISRIFNPFVGLMSFTFIKHFLNGLVDTYVKGPDAETRAAGCTHLRGEVSNATGDRCILFLSVAEGYQFTVMSSLACVESVLANDTLVGALTPSMAFGAEFVLQIPGSTLLTI